MQSKFIYNITKKNVSMGHRFPHPGNQETENKKKYNVTINYSSKAC